MPCINFCYEHYLTNTKEVEVTALAGINALQKFLISIGMPSNFAELGVKEEDCTKIYKMMV